MDLDRRRSHPDFGSTVLSIVDQDVGRDAFRLGAEVRQHAVPEHRMREGLDVVEAHVVPALGQGLGLRPEDQVLRGAHARAERHVLLHQLRRAVGLRPAGPDPSQRVAHHRLGDRHASHKTLERNQIRAGHRPLELRVEDRRRRPHDVELLVFRRMLDDDVEHEAIELRLG
jgi:hypothetical protein